MTGFNCWAIFTTWAYSPAQVANRGEPEGVAVSVFNVEPDPMMRESNRLLDGVTQSQSEHSRHHSDLEAQVPGMIGLSREALAAAHVELADQSRILHKRLEEHGMGMQEFTGLVVEIDEQGRQQIRDAGRGLQ